MSGGAKGAMMDEKLKEIVEWAKTKTPCASNYQCLLADLTGLLAAPPAPHDWGGTPEAYLWALSFDPTQDASLPPKGRWVYLETALEALARAPQPEARLTAEQAGRIMHESWCETKRKQGFHHPNDCPVRTRVEIVKNLKPLHELCKFCHFDLKPWDKLPEAQREINRHAFDALNAVLAAQKESSEPAVQVEGAGKERKYEGEDTGEN